MPPERGAAQLVEVDGAGDGGTLNVIRTTVPWPWTFPTPMTQVA